MLNSLTSPIRLLSQANPKNEPNVIETQFSRSRVLGITSERGSHRVDMKDAAFVKMRDSREERILYFFFRGPCVGLHVRATSTRRGRPSNKPPTWNHLHQQFHGDRLTPKQVGPVPITGQHLTVASGNLPQIEAALTRD